MKNAMIKKNSIRKFTFVVLLAFISTISMAQITKQQAIDYVMDSIVGNQSDSVNVYMDSLVQTAAYYNLNQYDSIQSPYSNYWLFFIDEMPEYLWGHDCKYVFINQANGDDWSSQKQTPPFQYNFILEEVSVPFTITRKQFDFSIPYVQMSPSIKENCDLFAVLFLGDDGGSGVFWSPMSHLYCALIEQGYPEENIFVLSYDGTASPQTNISLDLNNDGVDDILDIVCNVDNLGDVFSDVKDLMDDDGIIGDDMLFVYSFNHGYQYGAPYVTEGTYLALWEDPLHDYELAAMVQPISCSQMIFNIYACHAGGMADDLLNINNSAEVTVITAIDWADPYVRSTLFIDKTDMDVFTFWSISAYRGYYPDYTNSAPWARYFQIGQHPNFDFLFSSKDEINFDLTSNDGNNDGLQQINEIIQYTSEYDEQFSDIGVKEYHNGFLEDLNGKPQDDLLSLHGISGKVETTQTLSGSFLIGGQLSVEPGVELTLDNTDNTVSFHVFDSEIIIKGEDEANGLPGGLLKLEGATLTNACDIPWKGIQIWGNSNDDQYSSVSVPRAQGELIANNAIIENADIAVQLANPTDRTNTGGGIIHATNTLFKNNERALDFAPYKNIVSSSSAEYDNLADFTNCDFIINEDYLHNSNRYDGTQVKIHSVEGIEFKACTFENKLNLNLQTGRGIHSIDAGFEISAFNNENSAFRGFRHGIESSNTESSFYRIFIRESDFESNGIGVFLRSITNAVITDNTFIIGFNIGCIGNGGIGLVLENSTRFAVENNSFGLDYPITGDNYTGIKVINTNNPWDRIYKNSFDYLSIANYAKGKNHGFDIEKGLQYSCNINQNNNWDFLVDKVNYGDGIQSVQGSISEVAGNTFSSDATMHFENNGDYEVDYYYDNNSSSEVPDVNKIHQIKREPQTISNTCPNHYGGNNEIKLRQADYTQRESDYSSALSSHNSAEQSYGSTNDSILKKYYQQQMSYFNSQLSLAAYDIISSNLADTLVQDSLFRLWIEELNTYTSQETMVDYYLQKADYTKAWNLADSLKYNFTFTSYDSIEHPYYLELKELQIDWLEDSRGIFELTSTEISKLEVIADSSIGIAGSQAKAILSFAYDITYFYSNCVSPPDTTQKSSKMHKGNKGNELTDYIKVSPNPALNNLYFDYSFPNYQTNANISLYSISGKIIEVFYLTNSKGKINYNCSDLPSGIYYYKFDAGKFSQSGKIIIK